MLALQAHTEFDPQNPQNSAGLVVCSCNAATEETETGESLGFQGHERSSQRRWVTFLGPGMTAEVFL